MFITSSTFLIFISQIDLWASGADILSYKNIYNVQNVREHMGVMFLYGLPVRNEGVYQKYLHLENLIYS